MRTKAKVLNVEFDIVTREVALERLLSFIKEERDDGGAKAVYTPNPEMVIHANENPDFMEVLSKGDLVVADGIGVVLASKLSKKERKLSQRVAGCDLMYAMFESLNGSLREREYTVYLLGGKEGVPELAREKLLEKYENLRIIGVHNGYFDYEVEKEIIEEIKILKPDVVLVGLGFPKQEKWIHAHRDLPVKVMAGIGGSIDVMAGVVKRAPVFFQKIGMEWLYRLLSQPTRIGRIMKIPQFIVRVIKQDLGK